MHDRGGLTPAQRSLRSRLAAYSLHAQRDSKETTQAARAAFLNRFEREVDPDGSLPPAERARPSSHLTGVRRWFQAKGVAPTGW